MKLICLNTWGGRAGKDIFMKFLYKHEKNVSIFCLQEVWSVKDQKTICNLSDNLGVVREGVVIDMLEQISKIFQKFYVYFHPNFEDNHGLLTLIKKTVKVLDSGEYFVHKHKGFIPDNVFGYHARNLQYQIILYKKRRILIINFHGLWNGVDKSDNDERRLQSKMIKEFIHTKNVENIILCGDFNLTPDTKSLKILEESGLTNLIKKYKIDSTRSIYYNKDEKFADYILVSKNIKINSFKVLDGNISDHLPLFLDFDLKRGPLFTKVFNSIKAIFNKYHHL